MLPGTATITSINQAHQEIKAFGAEDWEGGFRPASRQALKAILQNNMRNWIDRHLEQIRAQGLPDRRNGYFCHHLLTELDN